MIKGDLRVTLEQSIEACCQVVKPGAPQEIGLEQAPGMVAAQSLLSIIDVPGFARSRVDGFTISDQDISFLKQQGQLVLKPIADITAGQGCRIMPVPGQTVRVATGAVLPPGNLAVVKEEDIFSLAEGIMFTSPLKVGENVEPAGSRMAAGDVIARTGTLLGAEVIEKLSSAGWTRVPVYKKPGVFVINTGSELALPGQPLKAGQIYASNYTYLGSKIQAAGAELAGGYPQAADCEAVLLSCIEQGLASSDLVIIAGGTGTGSHDLALGIMEKMGADILFNNIDSRPGRNVSAAVCKQGLIVNLPGQPHAAGLIFDVLVMPVIRKMMGLEYYHNQWVALKLEEDVRGANIRSLRRGVLVRTGEGLAAALEQDKHTGIRPLVMDIHPGQGRSGDEIKAIIL